MSPGRKAEVDERQLSLTGPLEHVANVSSPIGTVTMTVMRRETVEVLERLEVKLPVNVINDVARQAILALLDARDFLAYQLSHANGNVTSEELEELAKTYLVRSKISDSDLTAKLIALRELIPERLDADVASTIFRTGVDQAARVLTQVRLQLGPSEAPALLSTGDPAR